MDIFSWLEREFETQFCTSDKFIYDDMDSQSDFSLPIVYQPFDAAQRSHWADRGYLYDFLYTTNSEGKKVLDFGPGDGWPSLIIAPFIQEVIGLDSSAQRVAVCKKNALRMGITNAHFQCYYAGDKLPFADNSFDAITAASSVEQTPDPYQTLEEFYRVLKPGGKLRLFYESLNEYAGGNENELWIAGLKDGCSRLILFDRHIHEEYVVQYGITVSLPKEAFDKMSFLDITPEFLRQIRGQICDVRKLRTRHPSGKTYQRWLGEIGFSKVIPTYSGGSAAAKLYDNYQTSMQLRDLAAVDALIRPTVRVVTQLLAPVELNPPITVIK